MGTQLDALVIGNYFLLKEDQKIELIESYKENTLWINSHKKSILISCSKEQPHNHNDQTDPPKRSG